MGNICNEVGIQLQHIVMYTPQQNIEAKRKNWSLREMVSYMLNSRFLPFKFWVQVINYAMHIQNRYSHKFVK